MFTYSKTTKFERAIKTTEKSGIELVIPIAAIDLIEDASSESRGEWSFFHMRGGRTVQVRGTAGYWFEAIWGKENSEEVTVE